jgi:hypothetical protein
MQKIKVKLLTSIAGHSDEQYDQPDFGYAPGQVVELHPQFGGGLGFFRVGGTMRRN